MDGAYLVVDHGADQLSDGGQRLLAGLQGHRLPAQSDLQQEGDALVGASMVGGAPGAAVAGGRLFAIGQAGAQCGGWAG